MIHLIGLAILSWMFAEGFEPIQLIKYKLKLNDPDIYYGGLVYWIVKAINCSLCTGFWTGLIFFQDPFKGAIVSVVAEAISRLNKLTTIL